MNFLQLNSSINEALVVGTNTPNSVIPHTLSHFGNQDILLSTNLAVSFHPQMSLSSQD